MKSTGRAAGIDSILSPVAAAMGRVDSRLTSLSFPEQGTTLGAVLKFSLAHAGKRLRPALVLLTAGAYGRSSEAVIDLAAATECLHSATLIHDDIVDGAGSRRGKPAVHVMWSYPAAVLSGDFLFGVAADLVASIGRPILVRMFADTIMEMCRSEFGGPELGESPDGMLDAYLRKIRGKTACLFALCSEAAAELADAGEEARALARDYGLNLGMAFQIADDILDVKGDEAATGKPVGNDLRQRVLTLPAIRFLLEHAADGGAVSAVMEEDDPDQDSVHAALVELRSSGAVERAFEDAASFADKARECARSMPANACSTALEDLTHYVLDRPS